MRTSNFWSSACNAAHCLLFQTVKIVAHGHKHFLVQCLAALYFTLSSSV